MTLWDLLTALCFVMPIAGALATVKDTPKGLLAYPVAVVVGLVVGGLCAWTMRAMGNKVAARSGPGKEDQKPGAFRMLYFVTVIWIVVALFLGSWMTKVILRFV
jgi:hypothetical protein